jgi:pimeloyl-ACP methyl ester carboxylesterase
MNPTIVLVHGAFAESASWDRVIDPLVSAGHPGIAAANPLRGLTADAVARRSSASISHPSPR